MERDFIISNPQGLHARPATLLVQKANKYHSDMTIAFDGKTMDLKSIMAVLSLGITRGSLIAISIKGDDEVEAMKDIAQLIREINQRSV